ncbi:MAG: 2-succinyl-5-enolpyruvyl-6-hydroxy-3-cyclohexene-1-carboxylic-acid synthase [Acidobacteriota bacterium]
MNLDNLQIAWAEVLIDTLAQCGVRHALISPGSRSTPLTLAAARHPEIEAIPIIDERSAAFFALGLARSRGTTPLLVCTSGTAAAHYFPAVIEADLAELPLLLLTADRPPELQHRGAAQVIDQRHLFGRAVRVSYELGTALDSVDAFRGLRATAARAFARTQGEPRGPVHINAPFRKPLEPQPEQDRDVQRRTELIALSKTPVPRASHSVALPTESAIEAFATRLSSASRGLIVAGAALPDRAAVSAHALATCLGWPLLADSASQLRRPARSSLIAFHDLLLRTRWAQRQVPDLLLVLGNEPSGIGWSRWSAARGDVERLALGNASLPDPDNRVADWLVGELEPTVAALLGNLQRKPHSARPESERWTAEWDRAERTAARSTELASDPRQPLTESDAVRAVAGSIPDDHALVLGNSLPIRSVDLFAPPTNAALVLHQRGANGIDGLIAAAAAAPLPATLLIGDVAFLHDLGSLATARAHAERLTIVVLDNDGGRIFDQLPIAARPELDTVFERFFRTPPQLDVALACEAFGVACARVATLEALQRALAEPFEAPARVIWAEVVPDSAQRTLDQRVAALDVDLDR